MFYVQNKDKLSIGKKQVTMETDKEAKQDRQTQKKKERERETVKDFINILL